MVELIVGGLFIKDVLLWTLPLKRDFHYQMSVENCNAFNWTLSIIVAAVIMLSLVFVSAYRYNQHIIVIKSTLGLALQVWERPST